MTLKTTTDKNGNIICKESGLIVEYRNSEDELTFDETLDLVNDVIRDIEMNKSNPNLPVFRNPPPVPKRIRPSSQPKYR